MEIESKAFRNAELTVTYDPCICTLSGRCAKELSNVFSNNIIPWVNLDAADTALIIEQVKRCPSGALQYFKTKEHENAL